MGYRRVLLLAVALLLASIVWWCWPSVDVALEPPATLTSEPGVSEVVQLTPFFSIGRPGDGEFQGPFGVHVAAGEVFVADDLGHCIKVFDRTGRLLRRIGEFGHGRGQLAYLDAVITDAKGRLLVADTGNNRIQMRAADGTLLKEVRSWGWWGGFRNPRALALDAEGRLFVADYNNHGVQVFDAELRFLHQIGSKGSAAGKLHHPLGLVCDREGNVYVSDSGNHRVQVFTGQGRLLGGWGSEGTEPGQFRHPSGLTWDSRGRLIVADHGNHRLAIFTPQGRCLAVFGQQGGRLGEFDKPCGVAVDEANRLYVAEAGNHRVQVLRID